VKIAITHDWLTNWGGGEAVLKEMCRTFPDAHVFSAIVRREIAARLAPTRVTESLLGHAPFARRRWQWYLTALSHAFRSFDFRDYDLVIASSYYAAHHVVAKRVLCYKHSPARAVWGDGSYLAMHPAFPAFLKPLAIPQIKWFRRQDLKFSSRDACSMVANSNFCAKWCMVAYRRDDVRVIYPPVDIDRFARLAQMRAQNQLSSNNDYWLCWSRHASQKRLDIIVEAAAMIGERLILAGSGDATPFLMALANRLRAPVEFVGRVDDSRLDRLILGAKAFVFPAEEDFGIAPLEALAAALPVVAFNRGGVADWIEEGIAEGFPEQTPSACAAAMKRVQQRQFDSQRAQQVASQFAAPRFRTELLDEATRHVAH
jgi:glycosyltransferase involved in cell wall biosynthesis